MTSFPILSLLMANSTPVTIPISEKTGWSIFWEIADRSLTIGVLALAVYFVVKRLMRIETEKDALMKTQISDLRGDVAAMKEHVKECEKDRQNLYREIAEIKNR